MKPSILITIVVVLVILVIGVVAMSGKKTTTPPSQEKFTGVVEDIYGISGTITKIEGNTITLDGQLMMKDSTQAPLNYTAKVTVAQGTKITKMMFPSAEELIGYKGVVEPKETEIGITDLKAGDKIDVNAGKNIRENIQNDTAFTATTIDVVTTQ